MSDKVKIRPLYDRLLVKRLESFEEKTVGGIYIPDTVKEGKGQIAKVLAAGKGRLNADGSWASLMVKEGDTVFIGKYAGTDTGNNETLIIREDEVLGIIEQ